MVLHAAAGISFYYLSAHAGAANWESVGMAHIQGRGLFADPKCEITMVAPPEKNEAVESLSDPGVKALQSSELIHKTRAEAHPRFRKSVAGLTGTAVRGSAELLADPQVGRVFSNYFSRIKNKIVKTAKSGYSAGGLERGKTTLVFILRSDGSLDGVNVTDDRSDASAAAKKFAVDCVKKASPFPSFPEELKLNKISFSISVLFEEL